MKLALQLYTLRNYLGREQIEDTLRRTKEMGYIGVEWPGLFGYTPDEIAALTHAAGLELFSLHISVDDLLHPDTAMLDAVARIGIRWLPIGWLPEERLCGGTKLDETCVLIRAYSEMAAARGLYVLYHNHDFDLAKFGDATKLDGLYAALPANVLGAELDTCWLYSGGVDPVTYIQKYADRAPVLHLKDCGKDGGRHGYKPVGDGVLDWDAILPVCDKAAWLCVEQDEPNDGLTPFECAARSANFLLGR